MKPTWALFMKIAREGKTIYVVTEDGIVCPVQWFDKQLFQFGIAPGYATFEDPKLIDGKKLSVLNDVEP